MPLQLRVFLASPGDVMSERLVAGEVLQQLPYDPMLRGKVQIETVAWDQPGAGVPMFATMTPQAAIAAGLPKPSECDVAIVVLWSRMGTPLPPEYRKPDGSAYLSGTEWEFVDALCGFERRGLPQVLVYRRTERPLWDPDDKFDEKKGQWERVKSFFAAFRNPDGSIQRGMKEHSTADEFRRSLELDLRALIAKRLDASSSLGGAPQSTSRLQPPPLWIGSPFPGLRAYTPDDAPVFFGRGRETDELVRRLAGGGHRFIMVVGASGSGKSSLVAAGLLRLRAAS